MLLLGLDAPEDRRFAGHTGELFIVHGVEVDAGDHLDVTTEARLPGQGGHGVRVVAGYHLQADAGLSEAVKRLAGLGP